MAYNVINMPVSSSKYSKKSPYKMTPSYITVHNTANDASARNEVSYMRNNSSSTSYHVAIDDKEVVIALPFSRNAYHAGDGNGTGNRKSIGIEICYSKSGGSRFTAAEANAAKYIAGLLKSYGWGIERVKRHKDWSGKNCPHRTISLGWQRFLNAVKAEMSGSSIAATKPTASSTSTTSTSSTGYSKGKVYTLKANMNVRTGPGTKYAKKKRSALTANARAHCTSSSSAVLKKGTRVTCKGIYKSGNDIWLLIPSGYVCAKKSGKVYIS